MVGKILLTQTAFLGDVVLATPLVHLLRSLYPDHELHLLTTPAAAPLFTYDPRLHEVHTFSKRGSFMGISSTLKLADKLRSYGFDALFSLHRSYRTSLLHFLTKIPQRTGFADASFSWIYTDRVPPSHGPHSVIRGVELLKEAWRREKNSELPELPSLSLYPPTDDEVSGEILSAYQDDGAFVLLVPGSAWNTKRWHWTRCIDLIALLEEAGHKVWLAGSPDERELCEKIASPYPRVRNWSGRASIPEFLWLVQHTSGLVCNDSFALHVASAFQAPTAAVFCATSPSFGFGPWMNPFAQVVEKKGLWCKPCHRHGSKVCPTRTESCMRGVSAAEVFSVLSSQMKKKRLSR